MSNSPSENRLIQNEQIIRAQNTQAGQDLKKYLQNDPQAVSTPIAFVCECSVLDCNQHINISITDYEKLHQRKDRFTIYGRHLTPEIERVVAHEADFDVVEKFALPAR